MSESEQDYAVIMHRLATLQERLEDAEERLAELEHTTTWTGPSRKRDAHRRY